MTRIDLVRAFIAAWEARDIAAILARMTPDARYENVGMPVMVGHDAIHGFAAPFLAAAKSVRWDVHHIAETAAGAVLTERTDVFELPDRTLSIPVMGVFEFDGDLISGWRDYFDLPGFQRQMA